MTATGDVVIGVDVGTSLVKAGAYGADGTLLGLAQQPLMLRRPGGGRCEQDLDEFYRAAAAVSRRCAAAAGAAPGQIAAVAVAGQMAGIGLVDARLRPLAPFDSWLDTRCSAVVTELAAAIGDQVAAVAGCPPTVSIGPKMAWWRRYRPDLCAEAAAFVTAAGYVTARAAGRPGSAAFIDPSYLHFTAVADGRRACWDEDLIQLAGIDPALLPRIVESTDLVGELTGGAAADFGVAAGTPLAAGCGDTAACALGAGVTGPGQALDIAGTAAVLAVCLPAFAADTAGRTLMTMRSALPGRWYALGYVGGAGQVIEWVASEMFGDGAVSEAAYAALARAAEQVPAGSEGVLVSPHLGGRATPPAPGMRGTVIGLAPGLGRAHLARAALESIAFEYRRYADLAACLVPGHPARQVAGTGGGSRSRAWNQIKADVLGLPYVPVAAPDAGTRGAALVALAAVGRPPADSVPAGVPGAPGSAAQPGARARYAPHYERYLRWQDRLAADYAGERDEPTAHEGR